MSIWKFSCLPINANSVNHIKNNVSIPQPNAPIPSAPPANNDDPIDVNSNNYSLYPKIPELSPQNIININNKSKKFSLKQYYSNIIKRRKEAKLKKKEELELKKKKELELKEKQTKELKEKEENELKKINELRKIKTEMLLNNLQKNYDCENNHNLLKGDTGAIIDSRHVFQVFVSNNLRNSYILSYSFPLIEIVYIKLNIISFLLIYIYYKINVFSINSIFYEIIKK